ncbi:MAG TPA: WecB/TagA/CpsF family glycosyltransferase [Tepidisphaeraceae bacterium]|jgi:N-acetylglucosaminyldiphosphoundecaprenol N-acetyl-beta-D-mannosaminyltransferase
MTLAIEHPPLALRPELPPATAAAPHPRTDVLGVGISAINLPMAVDQVGRWIAAAAAGGRHYVCVTGVHGVMESRRDEQLRQIHNDAGMVTPDGMPMVWLSRLAGHKHVGRVYGPDLMLAVCEASIRPENGWRHYFYGGGDGVADRLAARLSAQFNGLAVAGTYYPPFRPLSAAEDAAVCQRINASGADIVWVGLSTPKQERWMAGHLHRIGSPVMIGVGAAFDFHAGLKRQAPRWMQKSGLEWLFRMVTEPRRLAGRYLTNNPRFVAAVMSQWTQCSRRAPR